MRVIILLLACMVCASYARRVQPKERTLTYADVRSFAHLLLANTPAGAFTASGPGRNVPGGPTHSMSRPALLKSQHLLGHIGMFFGPMDKSKGKDPIKKVQPKPKAFAGETDYDVIIVGAGCSGIGTALMLGNSFGLNPSKVLLVEQSKNVGESFRRWPKEMRFISPSFNQAAWTSSFDLNAISADTPPPSFVLRTQHPSGEEYARYLEKTAKVCGLDIEFETRVTNIRDMGKKGGEEEEEKRDHPGPFHVEVSQKEGVTRTMSTKYVVWAAGEFQYPKASKTQEGEIKDKSSGGLLIPGSELCQHNTRVQSWAALPGDEFVIIGGYESGMDGAINLAKAGKNVKVLASTPCWNTQTGDPSSELAPYTASRLREVLSTSFTPRPKLFAPLRVIAVEEAEGGGYDVRARWKDANDTLKKKTCAPFEFEKAGEKDSIVTIHTKQPPILCTGFEGSVAAQASHLFEFPDPDLDKKGCIGNGPLLTKSDESTKVPGVFLVGPSVTHGTLSFCFVYKFRQRFAVVANAICQGLGMDTEEAVAQCRKFDMYFDNFAACEGICNDDC